MESFWKDIQLAIRTLLKNPGFSIVAILTLALGIGATTAIFSVTNVVLLKPLPFHDPDRLVNIWGKNPRMEDGMDLVSAPDFEDWKSRAHSFESMAGALDANYSLTGNREPEYISGYRYDPEMFHVLGVQPFLGRVFRKDEARPGANRVVVLGYPIWQRRFGGDRNILGKPITLSGIPYTVIGVMPPAFAHPERTELWTPLIVDSSLLEQRNFRFLRVVARLKNGVTKEQAEREISAIATALQREHPDTNADIGAQIMTLKEMHSGDIRPALLLLLGAVAFLLLIACANIANLMLARGSARQREVSIRLAMGAGRFRLIRQFLTESVVLSLLGGTAGLLVAYWSSSILVAVFPNSIANLSIPLVTEIPLDARVLTFALAASLVTGVLFGLVPALQFANPDVNQVLKESVHGTTPKGRQRFRSFLVSAEVALAFLLLIGAGLLVKSFVRLQQGNLGLRTENVITMQVFLPRQKYEEPQKRAAFVDGVLQKMRSVPGVKSAGATNYLPLSGFWGTVSFAIEGRPMLPSQRPEADDRVATPGYFPTMGISLLRGRDFISRDRQDAPQVLIINETFAQRYWGKAEPIGKRLNLGTEKEPSWWEIIGVVSDVKSFGLDKETHLDIYRPFDQMPYALIAFAAHTATDPASVTAALRNSIYAVDKDQPIAKIMTMQELEAESVTLRRVSMQLLMALSFLALVLSALGIYGVMAYAVSRRTHEIGIRTALGAKRKDVLQLILKQGMKLAIVGALAGIVCGLILTRFMQALLYGVQAADPSVFGIVPLILLAVAATACLLPAMRAAKVDPVIALRYE